MEESIHEEEDGDSQHEDGWDDEEGNDMAIEKGDVNNDIKDMEITNPGNENLKENMSSFDTARIQRVEERMELLEKMMQKDGIASKF